MPSAESNARAASLGYCKDCLSPRDERSPTHGRRCDICWDKHLKRKNPGGSIFTASSSWFVEPSKQYWIRRKNELLRA